jgi:hypothetical protein
MFCRACAWASSSTPRNATSGAAPSARRTCDSATRTPTEPGNSLAAGSIIRAASAASGRVFVTSRATLCDRIGGKRDLPTNPPAGEPSETCGNGGAGARTQQR